MGAMKSVFVEACELAGLDPCGPDAEASFDIVGAAMGRVSDDSLPAGFDLLPQVCRCKIFAKMVAAEIPH